MQMILIQTEIEEAIRDYINNQVNVREGMRIDIDLSATRGPEGFKATIDIVREDAPEAEPTTGLASAPTPSPTPAPAPAPAQVAKIRKAAPPKEATQPSVSKPVEINENATPDDVVADAQEEAAEEPAEGPALGGNPEDEAPAEDTPAPKPTRSLFGNLTKPVNS